MTIDGKNAYYDWEMMQVDAIRLIKKLRIPTYIVQGRDDSEVSLDNGIDAYEDEIEVTYSNVEYKLFRKLNHLLMLYEGPTGNAGTDAEYDTAATLNKRAGRYLGDWVLNLFQTDDEE